MEAKNGCQWVSETTIECDFQSIFILNVYILQSNLSDKLGLLVGDYHSDSDNEDSDQRQKMISEVTTGKQLIKCLLGEKIWTL